ncbi:hypothetical protein QBC47DRAFT_364852 [Echria macrotheca]|uniref:Uncharacterized protein n=1 Tax=Echria macrotheca TaxID=438768 RepID=A0AAJ0F506_9PEZI|nr:hypothetical protein QBC47DRAFT_364852 [Echria macrotheca]
MTSPSKSRPTGTVIARSSRIYLARLINLVDNFALTSSHPQVYLAHVSATVTNSLYAILGQTRQLDSLILLLYCSIWRNSFGKSVPDVVFEEIQELTKIHDDPICVVDINLLLRLINGGNFLITFAEYAFEAIKKWEKQQAPPPPSSPPKPQNKFTVPITQSAEEALTKIFTFGEHTPPAIITINGHDLPLPPFSIPLPLPLNPALDIWPDLPQTEKEFLSSCHLSHDAPTRTLRILPPAKDEADLLLHKQGAVNKLWDNYHYLLCWARHMRDTKRVVPLYEYFDSHRSVFKKRHYGYPGTKWMWLEICRDPAGYHEGVGMSHLAEEAEREAWTERETDMDDYAIVEAIARDRLASIQRQILPTERR